MKLAIFIAQPFWYDGKKYTTRESVASFIIRLAEHVEELIIIAPFKLSSKEYGNHEINLPNNTYIIQLPFFQSLSKLYTNLFKILPICVKIVIANRDKFDLCGIFDSNILSYTIYLVAKIMGKRTFVYIRSNPFKYYPYQFPTLLGKPIGYAVSTLEDIICRFMVRNTLSFAIGKEIYERYKKGAKCINIFYASLISNGDIALCNKSINLFQNRELKLISVGRLVPQKGLEYLIDSVEELVRKDNFRIKCLIVGEGKDKDRLLEQISQKKLEQHITLLGYVPWGKRLLDLYRSCDFFISPSLSEGFPKTVFEALACGSLVISTNVGGISELINNEKNGLIINSKSGHEIAAAIRRSCKNPLIFHRIVNTGYKTAMQFTIETQTRIMIKKIAAYFISS